MRLEVMELLLGEPGIAQDALEGALGEFPAVEGHHHDAAVGVGVEPVSPLAMRSTNPRRRSFRATSSGLGGIHTYLYRLYVLGKGAPLGFQIGQDELQGFFGPRQGFLGALAEGVGLGHRGKLGDPDPWGLRVRVEEGGVLEHTLSIGGVRGTDASGKDPLPQGGKARAGGELVVVEVDQVMVVDSIAGSFFKRLEYLEATPATRKGSPS